MERRHQIKYCMGCMNPLTEDTTCEYCGFSIDTYESTPRCLPLGTMLTERYLIGKVIGEGSFGITYIGRDLLLDIVIAVKEYFPLSYGSRDVRGRDDYSVYIYHGKTDLLYQKGLKRFYSEATTLSHFHMLDGIVSVRDFFYCNNTAYIVMDYVNGITVKEYVKKHGAFLGKDMLALMRPVIRSLEEIHQNGVLHRDISPDNLLLNKRNQLVLVDFGSAKAESRDFNQSITVTFKRGYTPEEQYLRRGKQGAWSDVYSLCATMYYMLTETEPNEAIERMLQDILPSLVKMPEIDLEPEQKEAIMNGIIVDPEKRIQSMAQLYDVLYPKQEAVENKTDLFRKIFLYPKRVVGGICVCALLAIGVAGFAFAGRQQKQKVTASKTQTEKRAVVTTEPIKIYHMFSFVGMTRKQAEDTVKKSDETALTIQWSRKYSDTVKKGKIIEQSIPQNTQYRQGEKKTITLTISRGPKLYRIPKCIGKDYDDALALLKQKGFHYRIRWRENARKSGVVFLQIPQAGKRRRKGTKITLTVSSGQKVTAVTPEPVVTVRPTTRPQQHSSSQNNTKKQQDDDFIATIP